MGGNIQVAQSSSLSIQHYWRYKSYVKKTGRVLSSSSGSKSTYSSRDRIKQNGRKPLFTSERIQLTFCHFYSIERTPKKWTWYWREGKFEIYSSVLWMKTQKARIDFSFYKMVILRMSLNMKCLIVKSQWGTFNEVKEFYNIKCKSYVERYWS